ncbi:MAG: phosphate signaling complex protein PhoU [Bacteroidetes bacterium]|nr:phosphate signaling complex protein PhoU [Bacteroidota bacterium]
MNNKFAAQLEDVKKDLIFLANQVEDALYRALKALEKQDKEEAKEIVAADININMAEVAIEKKIFSLLALQQPVAIDLRFIVAALRMNNDLERIGDHAKNIAKVARKLSGEPFLEAIEDVPQFGRDCRTIFRDAVQAFINLNTDQAAEIRERDELIDKEMKRITKKIISNIKDSPAKIEQGMELINVVKHLERIADLAVNLGEDVIFMKDAKIIRYGLGNKEE